MSKEKFSQLTDSLKSVGNASNVLSKDLLNKFYVDPYVGNHAQLQIQQNDTTFLIGKKGSGKSTLLTKFIYETAEKKDKLAIYIDTRSLFIGARRVEDDLLFNEYNIFLNSLQNLFNSISEELCLERSINTIRRNEIKKLLFNIKVSQESIRVSESKVKEIRKIIKRNKFAASISKGLLDFSHKISGEIDRNKINEYHLEYVENVINYIKPISLMDKTQEILKSSGISKVFICFDEFSEISIERMKILIDVFISPLHYKADNFYKFKICAYPGRIYLGNSEGGIGNAGTTIIKLDFFERTNHLSTDTISLEIAKLKELLSNRFEYFFNDPNHFDIFCEKNSDENFFYKQLFQYTFGNPRSIGKILNILERTNISIGKLITADSLSDAAIEYYKNVSTNFFNLGLDKFHAFNEQLSISNLKEIYDILMLKAKDNYNNEIFSSKEIYANIFVIDKKYESYLQSLELCYLIFKLHESKKNEVNYSFYSLNCALCKDNKINKVKIDMSNISSYVQNLDYTNFTPLIVEYLYNTREFFCEECNDIQPFSKAPFLSQIHNRCIQGSCTGTYSLVSRVRND